MRYLFIVLALVGCSDAPETVETSEQSQAAVTYHMAANGFVGLPNLNTHLCHPTFVYGSGADSQSLILQDNVPQCGGTVSIGSTTVTAYPNSCVSPTSAQQGNMVMTVRCQPLSDFGPVTQGSSVYTHVWNGTGTLEHVSHISWLKVLEPTFDSYNACYLSGFGSMSVGNEYTWLTYSGGWTQLNTDGFRGLSASARCSRLGRAGGPVMTMHAWTGVPGTGISVDSGVCLVTQVNGGIDNGSWELTQHGGVWGLQVTGYVGYARAECYLR